MMQCIHCGHTELHLCSGKIKAYNDSFTPEQHEQRRRERMEALERAIAAGKELKEKYGIELICRGGVLTQKNLDYIDATDLVHFTDELTD
jgi:hypothetical protein